MGYIGKLNVDGSTHLVGSTLYGKCTTAAATAAKVVTCADFNELVTGVTIHVKFSNQNTAANPTLNVNDTGAKAIMRFGITPPSQTTKTSWYGGSVISFTYDGTYWQMNDWLNDDTTYSNASLGQGYGVDSRTSAATAVTVTLASYTLSTGGVVSVKFNYAVPVNATMNINGKGAKSIYYKGSAITGNIIQADDVVTFIYDGTHYHLLAIDHAIERGTGTHAHAEGSECAATGAYSHAEGIDTCTEEYAHASHVEGYGTLSNFDFEHVFGKYNLEDDGYVEDTAPGENLGTYVEVVGNGTSDTARSNARTLDWDGNEVLAGKLTVGADPTNAMDVVTKQYVDNKYVMTTVDRAEFQTVPGTNRFLIWLYDSYNSSSDNHGYRIDFNPGTGITYESISNGTLTSQFTLGNAPTHTFLTVNGLQINFQKVGNLFVQIVINGSLTSLPTGNTNVGTLPTGYKPNYASYNAMLENSRSVTNGSGGVIQLSVNATNGAVALYNYGAAISSSTWVRHNAMYPLAS